MRVAGLGRRSRPRSTTQSAAGRRSRPCFAPIRRRPRRSPEISWTGRRHFDRTLSAARHGRVCDAHGMVKLAELRLLVRVHGQRGPLKVGFTADGLELDSQGRHASRRPESLLARRWPRYARVGGMTPIADGAAETEAPGPTALVRAAVDALA